MPVAFASLTKTSSFFAPQSNESNHFTDSLLELSRPLCSPIPVDKRIGFPPCLEDFTRIFDTRRVLNFANSFVLRAINSSDNRNQGREGRRGLNGSANCRMGRWHNARPRFLPAKCILLPRFVTRPACSLHANPCFLGTDFSIHCPVKEGQRGSWGRNLIPSLSLFLKRVSAGIEVEENDEYKPLGLGVRLPRFCIKVDSNPSEIFSLSRLPPPNPCNFVLFSGSTADLRRSIAQEGFSSRFYPAWTLEILLLTIPKKSIADSIDPMNLG